MDSIKRTLEKSVIDHLFLGKAVLIFGARQVGKTTMVQNILKTIHKPYISFNGDDMTDRETLSEVNRERLAFLIGDNSIIFIDEAQRIQDIGLLIKMIVDTMPSVQVIASGSSSFELANRLQEPLTGRMYEFYLYPLSFAELVATNSPITEVKLLENRLLFGAYPEIIVNPEKAEKHIKLIANSYLFKDIFALEGIKKPRALETLVQALALQVGSEVTLNELSTTVGIDKNTVMRYISTLEQAFIIFRLPSFSRNLRKELRKGTKIYFYDNGVRNALIANFSPLALRTDVGALWENFMISERIKLLQNSLLAHRSFFWRTTGQQEIDYIETTDRGTLYKVVEFKYNPKQQGKARLPKTFTNNYGVTDFEVITKQNYEKFLLKV